MNKKLIVLFLAISNALIACQSPPRASVYVRVAPCPIEPLYPKITDAELSTVSDKTYSKLVDNFVLRDGYIKKLKVYCYAQ